MKTLLRDITKNVNGIVLRYLLFEELEASNIDYSIMIEMHSESGDEIECGRDFAQTKSEAVKLLEQMHEQTVTPDSLGYILEDYIMQKSFY